MTRIVSLLVCLIVLVAAAADAQSTRHLPVDMRSAGHAAKALEVDDDVLVLVDIRKTTYQACTVDAKTEALPPPPNPLGQVLAVLNPFIGGGPNLVPPPPPPPVPAGYESLDRQLSDLDDDASSALRDVNMQRQETRDAILEVPASLACTDNACANPMLAQTRLTALRANLGRLVDKAAVPIAGLNARTAAAGKAVMDKVPMATRPEEMTWLRAALGRLDAVQRTLDAMTDRRQSLGKAKEALAPMLERIDTFAPSVTQVVPLSVARNAKTTITVKCVNVVTLEPKVYTQQANGVVPLDVPSVSSTVVYQDMPWAIVTAGMLYSQVDKRVVGAAAFKTGTDTAGVATFERRVAQIDHADTQLMPFTFLNIAACRCRKVTPAAAVGFGLNVNNGGKFLEYFVGGSLIIGKQVGIQIGRHLGGRQEPSNGFAEGDVLSDKLTAVPTERHKDGGFALGLTFRIPLPK